MRYSVVKAGKTSPTLASGSLKSACWEVSRVQDFSLDADEVRMRAAAHHIVRNLTAGMAMITCRDQLLLSINSNLKTVFLSNLMSANQQQKDMVEQAATVTAQDNMELACAFIQKTAIEKATPEVDKHLITEYERRKHARAEGLCCADVPGRAHDVSRSEQSHRSRWWFTRSLPATSQTSSHSRSVTLLC
ncbi:CCR4-NOT transcription complex subunit 1-like [Macrosteles quadrilineatus]|uniref:CCR4-NOT transcription complex subunit 1-like n=1 Tax=Macrosteles quadrilineatus TaxID=74068 RepID=UPI0023E2726E|nr:CCR4-NOT transcription complex subunit 1-like [Macrosteles quadrilineatus]